MALPNPLKIAPHEIPIYPPEIVLRVTPGPQHGFFTRSGSVFFGSFYTVNDKSNRMGYRLDGPPIQRDEGMPLSIISEPCLPGVIQIPENGQPIILLNEQTVGGYAKIASVISPDLNRLAQALPGNTVRFKCIRFMEARRLYKKYRRKLATSAYAISAG